MSAVPSLSQNVDNVNRPSLRLNNEQTAAFDTTANTRTFVDTVLSGGMNGDRPDPIHYGNFYQLVEELYDAYRSGGPEAALRARNAIVNVTPELAPVLGESTERPPHPWERQSFTLVDAFAPREPLKYVVAGLFSIPSLSIVYGAPAALKSMLVADLCMCVAAGLPWLEPSPDSEAETETTERATTQCPVLWLDFDNGPRRTHERMAAMASSRSLPQDTPLTYVSMPNPWLDASNASEMQDVAALVKKRNAQVVVVDNLNTVSGNIDENSASMGIIMSHFRQLAEKADAAVIVIHHQRKGENVKGPVGDDLRGHSSINAAIDLALHVDRKSNSDTVTIRSTKTRGEDVWPFNARFEHDKKQGGELETARFYGLPGEDAKHDPAVKDTILDIVRTSTSIAGKGKLTDLTKMRIDVGTNRIRNLIDTLVRDHELVEAEETKGRKVYCLPS